MGSGWDDYPAYVSVGKRKQKNKKLIKKLKSQGRDLHPIEVVGNKRHVAGSFWGQSWCRHLESFSDYSNRLPRGRNYVRHGSVLDLAIEAGEIRALVSGTSLYRVQIQIGALGNKAWQLIQDKCSGQIGSLLELLQGKLSDEVMMLVADKPRVCFLLQRKSPLVAVARIGPTCASTWRPFCMALE